MSVSASKIRKSIKNVEKCYWWVHQTANTSRKVLSVYAPKVQKRARSAVGICIKNPKIHQKVSKVLLVGSSNCRNHPKSAVGICTKSPKTGKKCCRYMHQKPENPSKRVESAVGICTKLPTPHKKCCRYLRQKSENGQKVLSVSAPRTRKSIKKWLTRDDDNSKVEHFCEAKMSVSKETCQSYRSEQKNPEKGAETFLHRAICANKISRTDLKVR